MEYKRILENPSPADKPGRKGKHMYGNWQKCNHAITSIKDAKHELCEVFADLVIDKRNEQAAEILDIIEKLKKLKSKAPGGVTG